MIIDQLQLSLCLAFFEGSNTLQLIGPATSIHKCPDVKYLYLTQLFFFPVNKMGEAAQKQTVIQTPLGLNSLPDGAISNSSP